LIVGRILLHQGAFTRAFQLCYWRITILDNPYKSLMVLCFKKLDARIMLHAVSRTLWFAVVFLASMPPITALLHTANDSLRLGRCLETLRPCGEVIVVDHGSRDATLRIAREYGARVFRGESGVAPAQYLQFASHDWIFCLDPRESLTESLEATLFEWGHVPDSEAMAHQQGCVFSVRIREQTDDGWVELPSPQTRLVSRDWSRWRGSLPAYEALAVVLEGALLRFIVP
jgi:glycosyl transferase family 2